VIIHQAEADRLISVSFFYFKKFPQSPQIYPQNKRWEKKLSTIYPRRWI